MNDENGIIAGGRYVLNQRVPTVPKSKVVAVTLVAIDVKKSFAAIGIDKDNSNTGLTC